MTILPLVARALSRMSFLSRGLMVKGSNTRMLIFSVRREEAGRAEGKELGAVGLPSGGL